MSRNLSQNQREFLDLNYVPRRKRVAHSARLNTFAREKGGYYSADSPKMRKTPCAIVYSASILLISPGNQHAYKV